jgi:hypothetical protein
LPPLEIFRLFAGEFAAVADDVIEKWIELTKPLVSKKRFGDVYNQALALLTAHRLKLAGVVDESGGETGVSSLGMAFGGVSSYSEGETSISFAASPSSNLVSDGDLALTEYGVQFLSLRRMKIMPIISAGEAHGA